MNKKQKAVIVFWLLCMFLLLLQGPRYLKDHFESGTIERNHGSHSLLHPPPFHKGVLYNINSNLKFLPVILLTCLSGGFVFIFRDKKKPAG